MSNQLILPCNGLDKPAGCMAREIGLSLAEQTDGELVCPVLAYTAPARYQKHAGEIVTVIDGCATRCASKLATELGLKVGKRLVVADYCREQQVDLGVDLRLAPTLGPQIAACVAQLSEQPEAATQGTTAAEFPVPDDYLLHTKDKFHFRVPQQGFWYNENDCWVQVVGNLARVGVTDFVQQSLSDIIFFTPPAVGVEVEQFGEVGLVESSKAVFELVSPVAGKVLRVNPKLDASPELLNENPYELGWVAELELVDFAADQELLLTAEQYLEVLKRKVAEFHV